MLEKRVHAYIYKRKDWMGTKEFKYKDPCLYCKREETLANNITEKTINYKYRGYRNIISYNIRTKRVTET